MPESILGAIVETGVFTKFTYPRKQQTKVGLQKGTGKRKFITNRRYNVYECC